MTFVKIFHLLQEWVKRNVSEKENREVLGKKFWNKNYHLLAESKGQGVKNKKSTAD